MTRRRSPSCEHRFADLMFGAAAALVYLAIGYLGACSIIGTVQLVGQWLGW